MKHSGTRIWAALLVAVLVPACGTTGGGGTLTPTIAPAIPTDVEAFAGNRSVKITWTSPATGATFVVSRSLTSGGPYFPVSVPGGFTSATTYVDSGLSNGTSYYYVVSATNTFGSSSASAESGATPGFKPVSLSAQMSVSLAILPDKSLWAWGVNSAGQLGNGLVTGMSDVPVQVLGLDEVTAAAAGGYHSLALKSDGTVWSWGTEFYGATGNGVSGNTIVRPARIQSISGAVAVAAGDKQSFVILSDGSAMGFGYNSFGQLGLGFFSGVALVGSPVPVAGLTGVTAISTGDRHTLFLRNDGTVWVAGANDYGQLGLGSVYPVGNVTTPQQVPNLTGIVAVATGSLHSLALRQDGTVWAWGINQDGELGTGTATVSPVPSPVQVSVVTGTTAIAAGGGHSYALRSDGSVYAWGESTGGALGNGTITFGYNPTPAPVLSVAPSTAIASGYAHGLALGANGTLRSWGANVDGELGNGTGPLHSLAIPVLNLTDVAAISAGSVHVLTARTDGTVWGWGSNGGLQLGTAPGTPVAVPTQIPGITGAVKVAGGQFHSLALRTDATVWGWGNNTSGELGRGAASAASSTPQQVSTATGLTGAMAIAASQGFSLALKTDGTVWAWGVNNLGQLGRAAPATSASPLQVPGLAGIVAIAAGRTFALAVDNVGAVWAWGENTSGQLGNGAVAPVSPVSSSFVSTPALVAGLSGVSSVSAGFAFCLAEKTDGTMWSWGARTYGQLGDATISNTPATAPVQVVGWTQGVSVAAGSTHALALKNDGTVWSWGNNFYGELGLGDGTNRSVPTQCPGLSGILAISGGTEFSVALFPDHTVAAWGLNDNGQMATPYVNSTGTPVPITR